MFSKLDGLNKEKEDLLTSLKECIYVCLNCEVEIN